MKLNEEIEKSPAGIQQVMQSLVLKSKEYSEVKAREGISLTIYGYYVVELFSLAHSHTLHISRI